jgi:hypothetical protein
MCVGLPHAWAVVTVHRKFHDWLDWRGLVYPTRALVPLAAWVGVPAAAWGALAVGTLTRLMGTENSRFVMWGALPLVAGLHDVPYWAVAVHVLTFVRVP